MGAAKVGVGVSTVGVPRSDAGAGAGAGAKVTKVGGAIGLWLVEHLRDA